MSLTTNRSDASGTMRLNATDVGLDRQSVLSRPFRKKERSERRNRMLPGLLRNAVLMVDRGPSISTLEDRLKRMEAAMLRLGVDGTDDKCLTEDILNQSQAPDTYSVLQVEKDGTSCYVGKD